MSRKKARQAVRKGAGKGNHGRRTTPTPTQVVTEPPLSVLSHVGSTSFKPSPGMVRCLEAVAADPTLASTWTRIAKAGGVTQSQVSQWCARMPFLAWWHDQVTRIQALKSSEAVAVLAELAVDGKVKDADRIAAAKAYHAAVDKEAPGADQGMAALMKAMAGTDGDIEMRASRGDEVLEVKASTRKRAVTERVKSRRKVGGILEDAASLGVFQAQMPGDDVEAAVEEAVFAVIEGDDEASGTLTDKMAEQGKRGSVSDNGHSGADTKAEQPPSKGPNIDAIDPWAEDDSEALEEGRAGRKSRAASPTPKASSAHSPSEIEPSPRVIFLDLTCPECRRVLMKIRHGMAIPAIECPYCKVR